MPSDVIMVPISSGNDPSLERKPFGKYVKLPFATPDHRFSGKSFSGDVGDDVDEQKNAELLVGFWGVPVFGVEAKAVPPTIKTDAMSTAKMKKSRLNVVMHTTRDGRGDHDSWR